MPAPRPTAKHLADPPIATALRELDATEVIAGLTSPSDAAYLRWLVEFLQARSGFGFAFVGELWGEDMDRVRTLAVQSAQGPVDNFEYDLLHTPCYNVVGGDHGVACSYPRGVAPQFPEDLLLVEMGIESYVGLRLNGPQGQPVGLLVLLDTQALDAEQVATAEAMLQAFRGRTETVLIHRRTLRDLKSFESQLDPSESDDLLFECTRATVQAMHVEAAFVAVYVDDSRQRMATLAVSVGGRSAPDFAFDVAGSPCEHDDEPTVVITDEVQARFGAAEFLARFGARSFLGRKLHDGRGAALGYFAVVHDRPLSEQAADHPVFRLIAERVAFELQRRSIEAERRAAERRMLERQRSESLGILAGGIAHDFNNLLVGVIGNAELGFEFADARVRPYLVDILESAEQAAQLCNQMLAYAGRARIESSRFELGALIGQLAKLLRASIPKTCELVLELDDAPLWLHGDQTQITQIVMNLITNGADAIGEQPGQVHVRTSIVPARGAAQRLGSEVELQAGEHVLLEVQDSGCGMDEATRVRIFDPFFTTKQGGHGLGLAAMLGIVKRHDGGVHVDSEPGRGTTVSLVLPLSEPGEVERRSTTPARGARRRTTVLVVDDEPSVRKVLTALLDSAGHQVVLAEDGLEALEVYTRERARISVVLLDVSMPRLGGLETLARLRAIDPAVKVVLSSGRTELDRVAGEQPDRVVQKPYRMHVLLELLDELI